MTSSLGIVSAGGERRLVRWARVAGAVALAAIVALALASNVGQGGETMVAALEQLVASTDGGIIGAGGIRGQGLAAGAMLLWAGHNGAGPVQDVVALAGAVRALAVTLFVLIDKVLLCWGLHHVDEHRLDLDAAWVVLDVDLAEHDCWGLVEHNWGGLDNQWRMVHQHLGGWATHNDGCRTMDQNLALVLWVGDR